MLQVVGVDRVVFWMQVEIHWALRKPNKYIKLDSLCQQVVYDTGWTVYYGLQLFN